MAELKYSPVTHDHKAFLARAEKRRGFKKAYDALELEYGVASQMLKARSRAGLTQDIAPPKARFPAWNRQENMRLRLPP